MSKTMIDGNVPIDIKTKLMKWSIKFKIDYGVLESKLVGYYNNNKDWKKAYVMTVGDLQYEEGSLISNAPAFYCYVISDSGAIDFIELMKNKAKRMFESTDEKLQAEAVDKGMISTDGTPLDYRPKVFGKDNPNFGLPMTGHSWQRTFLAIVSEKEDFTGAKLMELVAKNENVNGYANVQKGHIYKFRGNPNKKSSTQINLGVSSAFKDIISRVTLSEIASKIDYKGVGDRQVEYETNFAGKKRTNYMSCIKGTVTWLVNEVMGARENQPGRRMFILTDMDSAEELKCMITETEAITFNRGDEVVVFCKLFAGKRDGKIGADVKGYMVI